nr:site-specific DNA-methyltransferase [Chlorobium sp.]
MNSKQEALFKTEMVPAKDGSGQLFEEQMVQNATPVTCLGKTFPDDEARRANFTELLAEKLRDPEFRKIEGFPIGTDEDILKLSDPPYYTACPNPWIADFIAEWEAQKPEKPEGFAYHREPFAADVSEGKSDPIYNAHTYHTKVPHKAIMRYILHYTEPGDIVYDGFCGTGMTGVAAQLCGDRAVIESLGYKVQDDNTILQEETDENGKKTWLAFSKMGVRRVVLNDLSPVATFIASNYNKPIDVIAFEREAKRILQEVEEECGWMYETHHSDSAIRGTIENIVWSDVFICPECTGEMIFYYVAVDKKAGTVLDEFPCPHCSISLTKRKMDRAWISKYDTTIQSTLRQAKQVPVLINYVVGKKRYQKTPDAFDVRLIQKIEESEIPYWFPEDRMLEGGETRRNDPFGITHVHHFYTKRNLWILSAFRDRCKSAQTLLWFNSQLINISKLNRYRPGVSFPYNPLSGTLYIGSQVSESSVFTAYKNKLNKLITAFKNIESPSV